MDIYECQKCGHLEFGEAAEKCLVCQSAKDSFKLNNDAVEKVGLEGRAEADQKHLPSVSVEIVECNNKKAARVKAFVGDIEHPMQEKHFIRYLDFYLDNKFFSRIWLSPEINRPGATLCLNAEKGSVKVVENCSLHGNWLTEVEF